LTTVKQIYNIRIKTITHVIILGGLLIFQFLPLLWCICFPFEYWVKQAIFYFLWVCIFYVNLFFLIPKLLYNHRAVLFFIIMVLLVVGMVMANHKVDESLEIKARLKEHFHLKDSDIGKQSDIISDSTVIIITLLLIGCSTIMGVTEKIQRDALLRKDLESDKVSAELAFLKAQINPHFLFNTLNSIFVLTAENERAHQAVYNLSKMMRYVLYETEEKQTTLRQEIIFLEEYLSLMELRLNDNVKVSLRIPEQLHNLDIAPMLFLPLVENAFKHGVSGTADSNISFDLKQVGTTITFTATNQIFSAQPALPETSRGIGLANTRRRLELLYPDKYTLEAGADATGQLFTVVFKLNLS